MLNTGSAVPDPESAAERWSRIEPLLDAALDLPPHDRPTFLRQACGADVQLRTQVEQLLSATDTAQHDLDRWAGDLYPGIINDDHDTATAPPTLLADRYVIERELGRGGMAIVYLAADTRLHRQVAVKVMNPQLSAESDALRFSAEIRTTANLRHANIVPLFDSGEADGWTYFVMPFVAGETLRERLLRRGMTESEAVRIVRAVLSGLSHAHEAGVIHRDIKPSNIMLVGDEVLLADFGIARVTHATDSQLTASGLTIGTPAYMSPEQYAGKSEIGPASDVYSTGCVLHELLCGKPPVSVATRVEMTERGADPLSSLSTTYPHLSHRLVECLQQAMALTPLARYPSARAFSSALDAATRSGPSAGGKSIPAPAQRKAQNRISRTALGVFALAAVAMVGAFLWIRTAQTLPLDPHRVVIFPLTVGNGVAGDTTFATTVRSALLGALNSTGDLQALDAQELFGAAGSERAHEATAAERGRLARAHGAGFFVDGRIDVSDSIRVQWLVHDASNTTSPHTVALPAGTSAWTVGLRAASALVSSLMRAGSATELKALESRPPTVAASFLRGEASYRNAHFDDAVQHFTAAVTEDSTFAFAWLRLSEAARWAARDSLASVAINAALRDSIQLPARLRRLAAGERAYLNAKADDAVRELRASLRLDDRSAEAWMVLGDVYTHLLPSDAAPDSVADDAFRRVHQLDRAYVPVLPHLIEAMVRRGNGVGADSLLQQFRATLPDSIDLQPLEVTVQCARAGPKSVRWDRYSAANLMEAARALAVGGLRQPACALAAAQAAYSHAPIDARYGALTVLQGVLIALGRYASADSLIQAATEISRPNRGYLYMLDALATGDPAFTGRAADVTDTLHSIFITHSVPLKSLTLWRIAVWLTHTGRVHEARAVQDSLDARVRALPDPATQYFAQSISARALLAHGDSARAREALLLLAPFAAQDQLPWNPENTLSVDRLLAAELELRAQHFAEATRIASYFDSSVSSSYPIFLAASLQIRIMAAQALRDEPLARRLTARLRTLQPAR